MVPRQKRSIFFSLLLASSASSWWRCWKVSAQANGTTMTPDIGLVPPTVVTIVIEKAGYHRQTDTTTTYLADIPVGLDEHTLYPLAAQTCHVLHITDPSNICPGRMTASYFIETGNFTFIQTPHVGRMVVEFLINGHHLSQATTALSILYDKGVVDYDTILVWAHDHFFSGQHEAAMLLYQFVPSSYWDITSILSMSHMYLGQGQIAHAHQLHQSVIATGLSLEHDPLFRFRVQQARMAMMPHITGIIQPEKALNYSREALRAHHGHGSSITQAEMDEAVEVILNALSTLRHYQPLPPLHNSLHLLAFTPPPDSPYTCRIHAFREAATYFGLPWTEIQDTTTNRMATLRSYLAQQPPDMLVCVVDATVTLPLASMSSIVSAYRQTKATVLFSAQTRKGSTKTQEVGLQFPPSTPWHHLSPRGFIGPASSLLSLLEAARDNYEVCLQQEGQGHSPGVWRCEESIFDWLVKEWEIRGLGPQDAPSMALDINGEVFGVGGVDALVEGVWQVQTVVTQTTEGPHRAEGRVYNTVLNKEHPLLQLPPREWERLIQSLQEAQPVIAGTYQPNLKGVPLTSCLTQSLMDNHRHLPLRFYILDSTNWRGHSGYGQCMTKWSQHMFEAMKKHPQRTYDLSSADVIMVDWETGQETNYPQFGQFGTVTNWAMGTYEECFRHDHDEARLAAAVSDYLDLGFKVIAFDASGIPDVYHHPDVVVATMDMSITRHRYRSQQDISFPTMSTQQQALVSKRRQCGDIRYLLTFQGTSSHPLRLSLAQALHNGHDMIVRVVCPVNEHGDDVPGCSDRSDPSYPSYEELLSNTYFSLVVVGDSGFSFRLMEVMAAGSIPVVLSDDWRLPFDEVIDWDDVAIRVKEEEATVMLPSILRGMKEVEVCAMRVRVRDVYDKYFATFERQLDGLLEVLRVRHGRPPPLEA